MRVAEHKREIEALLVNGRELTVRDFMKACPEVPQPTVFARIRALVKAGRLSVIGRGKYAVCRKLLPSVEINPWMKEISDYLTDNLSGVNNCICQKNGNLYLEVPSRDIDKTITVLKHDYPKVVALKDANRFPAPLEGYIIVGRLITDSPLSFSEGIPVPSLEKQLVDTIVNAKSNKEKDVARELQRAFDVYAVNQNKLARYASRRGVKEELDSFMNSLDNSRIEKFARLQKYFAGIPVTKAWLFGSFARCEETDSSDIDILFSYDEKVEVSLINIIRWKLDISKIFGREVDLVEDGFLRPFAQESADRDKYLIYERSN